MNNSIILIFVFALALALPGESSGALALGKKSKVSHVTLFKDRAIVSRDQTVSLQKGAYSITFQNVTPLADRESLKVIVTPKNAVQVLGIRTQDEHFLKTKNKEVGGLLKQRKKLVLLQNKLIERVRALLKEGQGIRELQDHYVDSFTLNLHVGKWSKKSFEAFLRLTTKKSKEMVGIWKKAYLEYHKLRQRLEFIQNKIRQLESVSDKESLTIVVDCIAEGPVRPKITIKYLVQNVGWSPTYDVRINRSGGKARIEQYAITWQNSGEDWINTQLTLSNLRAELRPTVPSISSYRLSFQEVKDVKTSISSSNEEVSDLMVGSAAPQKKGGALETGLAKNFVIKSRQTIRSGMARTQVKIGSVETPYKERLEVVAFDFDHAYYRARLINKFVWKIAAGPMNIYSDGEFIQQTWLNSVPVGGEFFINSGIDHNMVVNHWYSHKKEDPGPLSSKKHMKRKSVTRIRNWNKRAKTIRVYDRIPISEIDSVEVSSEGSTKGSKKLEKYPGWVYWDVKIESRKLKDLVLKLDITVPEDFNFQW